MCGLFVSECLLLWHLKFTAHEGNIYVFCPPTTTDMFSVPPQQLLGSKKIYKSSDRFAVSSRGGQWHRMWVFQIIFSSYFFIGIIFIYIFKAFIISFAKNKKKYIKKSSKASKQKHRWHLSKLYWCIFFQMNLFYQSE